MVKKKEFGTLIPVRTFSAATRIGRANGTSNYDRMINCLLIGAVQTLLVQCYVAIISPIYQYAGMLNNLNSVWSVVFPALLAIALSLILPVHCLRPSDYAVWVLYIGVIVPVSVIPVYFGLMPDAQVFQMQGLVAGGFICLELFRRRPPFTLPAIPESSHLVRIMVPAMVLVVVAIVFGLQGFTVDLSLGADMYTRRVSARSLLPAGSLLAYASALAAKTGVPILAALTIAHRSFIYIPMMAFCIVGLISFDGQKAFLYGPIMCLLFGWIAKRHAHRSFSSSILVAATAAFVGLSIAEYYVFGSIFVAIEFIRRLFFMPAQLMVYYFDFFQHNPLVWMTDGILGTLHIVVPMYDLPTPQVIGSIYFGNSDTNANVNFLGSAYANFGALGVLITGAAAGFVLRMIDSIVAQRPTNARFIAGVIVAFMAAFTWTEGSFQTSLLSDGVLLSCFLLACFPSGERKLDRKATKRKLAWKTVVATGTTARQA